MTQEYAEYRKKKDDFFNKHISADWNVSTSEMDEYDRYTKQYSFSDGAEWYELMTPVTETVTVNHRGLEFKQNIKMMKTEYWSTESGSKYYYEKW